MSIMALAGRYAKALFELAEKKGCLSVVEGDLLRLMQAINSSSDLRAAINNPVISKKNIEGAISDLLSKLGANKLTTNFLSVLVQNGRVEYIGTVVSAYNKLMMQSRGEENAYVVTASEIAKEQVTSIEKALGKVRGSNIKAIMSVNDEILGGVIVRIGSMMFDASVSGQLEKITALNKEALANLN